MKEFLSLLILLIIILACSKKTNPTPVQTTTPTLTEAEKVEKLALETFKKDFQISYNESKTVACISKSIKTRPSDIFPTLSLVLYNPKEDKILLKETIARGSVQWINDTEIKVTIVPGQRNTPKKNLGYIFNIKASKKRILPGK